MVRLTNLTPSTFDVTKFHDSYCAAGGTCQCQMVELLRPAQDPSTGAVGQRTEEHRVAAGFSIPPRDSVDGLEDAVLEIPNVREALRRGILASTVTPNEVKAKPKRQGAEG